jgi:O-antigen/teichoic acid export membrane protein
MKINENLLIIVTGRLSQIIIMLVSIRLVTTLLSPLEIGNYYIIFALMAFYNLVFLNPIETYMNRHLNKWKDDENLLNSLFIYYVLLLFMAILSIPISIIIYNIFNYHDNFNMLLFILFIFISIIISSAHRKIIYGLNTLHYRKEFMLYLITTLVLGLGFSVLLTYYFPFALGWLFGLVFAELILLYSIYKIYIKNNNLNLLYIKEKLTKRKIKEIIYFSYPIAMTTFLMWGQNTSYRLIIDMRYSAEILGIIAVGFAVSSAVFNAIQSISMQYFNPIFLTKIHNANRDERTQAWNNMAEQITPIYVLTLIFTVSLSQVLVNLLVDEQLHSVYIYTMIGAGIEFFRVMTNLLVNVSQSEYKTKSTILPFLFGFTIVIVSFLTIDFTEQYYMIAFVLLFAYLIVYMNMYINMKKILYIKYNIDLLKLFTISIPFLSIFAINNSNNILYNFLLLTIYGLYYLYAIIYILNYNKGKTK